MTDIIATFKKQSGKLSKAVALTLVFALAINMVAMNIPEIFAADNSSDYSTVYYLPDNEPTETDEDAASDDGTPDDTNDDTPSDNSTTGDDATIPSDNNTSTDDATIGEEEPTDDATNDDATDEEDPTNAEEPTDEPCDEAYCECEDEPTEEEPTGEELHILARSGVLSSDIVTTEAELRLRIANAQPGPVGGRGPPEVIVIDGPIPISSEINLVNWTEVIIAGTGTIKTMGNSNSFHFAYSTLTLTDHVTIEGRNDEGISGGMVSVGGNHSSIGQATLNMSGNASIRNIRSFPAVFVNRHSVLNMSDNASIEDNQGLLAVMTDRGSRVHMTDYATIRNNTGGGMQVGSDSRFYGKGYLTMSGNAQIYGNTSGGFALHDADAVLSGHVQIRDNDILGITIQENSTLNISGNVVIRDNDIGVHVSNGGWFRVPSEINIFGDAQITGNNGVGVDVVANESIINIYGNAQITDNVGGIVVPPTNTTVNIYGNATVSDNHTNGDGGGVHLSNGSTGTSVLNIFGNATILDNTAAGDGGGI